MRKIVVSVQNGLLAESISRILEESGEFRIYRSVAGKPGCLTADCRACGADVLLMEVSYAQGLTLRERLAEGRALRKENGGCKIAVLCDENTVPDLAREVALAKRDGLIDAFFYSSVTGSYLAAALAAL